MEQIELVPLSSIRSALARVTRRVLADDLVQERLLGIAGSVREGRARVRLAGAGEGQGECHSMPHAAGSRRLVWKGGLVRVDAEPHSQTTPELSY
jgi:hypothetical protein